MFDLSLKKYGYQELLIAIILNVFGLIFIQSSLQSNMSILMSQLMISIISLIFCLVISFLNLKRALARYEIFYAFLLMALLSIIIIGTASGRNSTRWIEVPIINAKLQPSEFVKLFFIIYMSKYIEKTGIMINRFGNLIKVVMFFAIPFVMILAQPNLSSSLILLFIFISMLFASHLDLKWFIGGGLIVTILIFIIYLTAVNGLLYRFPILKDYQKQRIVSFFSPTEDDQGTYQQENSIMAIGSGRLFGKGINNDSTQSVKNGNWLVEEQNDFIFAIVGEEIGFFGSLIIILLYIFLIISCLFIAGGQREEYKKLICVGIAGWIATQSFVNLGVATGVLPNTGVPLPFFSQGGSSLLSIYMAMGLIINIKRDVRGR